MTILPSFSSSAPGAVPFGFLPRLILTGQTEEATRVLISLLEVFQDRLYVELTDTRDWHVRWETPQRGVPRKYYRLTDAGRAELALLTHEWTTFAKAMTRLLRQDKEGK